MTKLREPGEVWHVGWDWFAHMWYVEPPFDVELDEPIKWFNDRDEAFNFVDDWIREQPVQVSVLDQSEVNVGAVVIPAPDKDDDPTPTWERAGEAIRDAEPVRQFVAPVRIPTAEEAQSEQERRLAEYNARVGIK